jgi:hypothetical protein
MSLLVKKSFGKLVSGNSNQITRHLQSLATGVRIIFSGQLKHTRVRVLEKIVRANIEPRYRPYHKGEKINTMGKE